MKVNLVKVGQNILRNNLLAWFVTSKYVDIWHMGPICTLALDAVLGTGLRAARVRVLTRHGHPCVCPCDPLVRCFSTGAILLPRGTFGNVWRIPGCHNWSMLLASLGETRYAAKHPVTHRTVPHSKDTSGPKCQLCRGWEILLKR